MLLRGRNGIDAMLIGVKARDVLDPLPDFLCHGCDHARAHECCGYSNRGRSRFLGTTIAAVVLRLAHHGEALSLAALRTCWRRSDRRLYFVTWTGAIRFAL